MHDPNNPLSNHPWLLPFAQFRALPKRGHPGGSSMSGQFFEDKQTQVLWIGKCGAYALMGAARDSRYREEFLEVLGVKMYTLLGVPMPETGLCSQPVPNTLRTGFPEYHFGKKRFLHVFSRFVDAFEPYGANFTTDYRQQASRKQSCFMIATQDNGAIPLRGFGAALAVADFLHDTDCVGNTGGNIGWVIAYDEQHVPCAQTLKIDPGAAFNFLPGSMLHNPDDKLNKQTLSGHDAAARDLWIGPSAGRLRYEDLMPDDQREFVTMARHIITVTPEMLRSLVEQACVPEGLSRELADALVGGLIQRQRRLIAAFAPELHAQIQVDVIQQRARRAQHSSADGEEALSLQRLRARVAALNLMEIGAGPCWMFQLPPARTDMIVREVPLMHLTLGLQRTSQGLVCQGICGLGGMGKTQLALQYAHSQQGHYQRIVWIYAEAGIEGQMRELGRVLCGIEEALLVGPLMQRIYQHLESERVLMVFDNVDGPDDLITYLPPAGFRGNLHLVTTQRRADVLDVPTFSLEGFTREESVAYVTQCLGEQLEVLVNFLLDALEDHPLALAHAVAYIEQGRCQLAEYPQRFYLHQLRNHVSTDDPTLDTVRTSLMLSLLQVREQQPQAVSVLQSCVGLAADNIPLKLLAEITKKDLKVLQVLTDTLARYSLLRLNLAQRTVSIHRLLLLLLDDLWPDAVARQAHLKQAIQVLATRLTYDNRDFFQLAFAKSVAPHGLHIVKEPRPELAVEQAYLSFQLGHHYLYNAHEYELAQSCFKRSLVSDERHYGKKHPQVAATLTNLGNACGALGDANQQKNLLERALVIYENYYGKIRLEVGITCLHLGKAWGVLGNVSQEKILLERALSTLERCCGPHHPEVATTLESLAIVYGKLGDATQKKEALERAMVIQERHYGKYHPAIVTTLENLGVAYSELGEGDKGKKLLERALEIEEKHDGKEHPELMAPTLANLALAELSLKQPQRALLYAQRSLTIFQQAFGSNHPQAEAAQRLLMRCQKKLLKIQLSSSGANANELTDKLKRLKERYSISPEDTSSQAYAKLFRCAAVEGEFEIVCYCYKEQGISLDSQDTNPRNLRTALHWACLKGHSTIIQYLLKQGAHFDVPDSLEKMAWEYVVNTPLLMLFQQASETVLKQYPMVKVLPGSSAHWGKLLRMAVVNNRLADVRYCTEVLKININETDDNPASLRAPLHWAVIKKHDVIAHWLLGQGANPNLPDARGKTPIDYGLEVGDEKWQDLVRLNESFLQK